MMAVLLNPGEVGTAALSRGVQVSRCPRIILLLQSLMEGKPKIN